MLIQYKALVPSYLRLGILGASNWTPNVDVGDDVAGLPPNSGMKTGLMAESWLLVGVDVDEEVMSNVGICDMNIQLQCTYEYICSRVEIHRKAIVMSIICNKSWLKYRS